MGSTEGFSERAANMRLPQRARKDRGS